MPNIVDPIIWDTGSFVEKIANASDTLQIDNIDPSGSDYLKIGDLTSVPISIGNNNIVTYVSGVLSTSFLSASNAIIPNSILGTSFITTAFVGQEYATAVSASTLTASNGFVNVFQAINSNVTNETVTTLTASTISASNAYIGVLSAGFISASDAIIDNANFTTLTSSIISASNAYISTLSSSFISASDSRIDNANFTTLTSSFISGANISASNLTTTVANIAAAAIANLLAVDANITTLTASTVTGTYYGDAFNLKNNVSYVGFYTSSISPQTTTSQTAGGLQTLFLSATFLTSSIYEISWFTEIGVTAGNGMGHRISIVTGSTSTILGESDFFIPSLGTTNYMAACGFSAKFYTTGSYVVRIAFSASSGRATIKNQNVKILKWN